MIPRLATSVWVGALLRRADVGGVFGAVLRKGDPVAGAVILIARAPGGEASVWTRVAQGEASVWAEAMRADGKESPRKESPRIEEYVARQARYDPDLWVVELITKEIQPLIADVSRSI